jgi:hypothetical protein
MNPPGLLWLQADLQVHSARTTTSLRDVMAKSAILAKQPAAMDCARQPRVPTASSFASASEAIHLTAQRKDGLLRFARNDGAGYLRKFLFNFQTAQLTKARIPAARCVRVLLSS